MHWEMLQELRATGNVAVTTQKMQTLRAEKQRERAYVISLLENTQVCRYGRVLLHVDV